MQQAKAKGKYKLLKRVGLLTGAAFVGIVAIRGISHLLSPREEEDIDDNAPQKLVLHMNERRYPPFYDREIQGIRVEGELDASGSKQLVVIGVDQKELDTAMKAHGSKFAIAQCDGVGLWHPAVAEKALLYGVASDQHGDVYAVGAFVGPSILMLLPGVISADGHFTGYKSTRVLALTNSDGLLYDYPNVPIVDIAN